MMRMIGLAALFLASSAGAVEGGRDLDDLIAAYNALPDTQQPLAAEALPAWVRDLALSHQEAAALVALAGSYASREPESDATDDRRVRHPIEYVAGAAVALKTQDVLNSAYPGTTTVLCCAVPVDAFKHTRPPVRRPPAERFVRLVAAFESCSGAFSSLALKLREAQPDSPLSAMAIRARSDSITFIAKPDPTCQQHL